MVHEFQFYNAHVDVHDPWVDPTEALEECGIELVPDLRPAYYDAVVLAVAHDQYRTMAPTAIKALGKPDAVYFDVKNLLPASEVDERL